MPESGSRADTGQCTVSVIMPAYNGEQYIAQSVTSVLGQSVSGWELIIVDDGSSDRTAEIVAEFQKTDDRVRYFRQGNSGQAAARNKGIRNSLGDLIAFIDQDDLWLERKLELQVKAIEGSDVDVVFSNGYIFTDEDVGCETISFPEAQGKYSGPEMFRLLFIENRIPILTALLRKETLTKAGLLEEDLRYQNADDYDLWLRLAADGATFLGLAEKLVRYRMHPAQASSNVVKMLEAELAVLKKHERATILSHEDKVRRFRSVYRKLVRSLLDGDRSVEARAYFRELLVRQPLSPANLAQGALLWVTPRHSNSILDLLDRVKESVSYRLGRPIGHFISTRLRRPFRRTSS